MRKPRALQPGDGVGVIAPASNCSREEFDRGVEELRQLGFVPVYDESVLARSRFTAGSAQLRADALTRAWQDPSIGGLIGVRGGYGSMQLLPLLTADFVRRASKPLIGYSDLTALLTLLTTGGGLVGFHGPTLERLGRGVDGYDRESLLNAVSRREPMGELAPSGVEVIKGGEAAGVLLGGTLTMLVASLGTPFAFAPPQGYVLLLEDVGERPYRIDRMLTQFRQAGLLARAVAVVVALHKCDEPASDITARSVIADMLADFRGPVIFGFPVGHTPGPAMTVPLGVNARVVASGRPRLVIEESAVE